MTDREAENAQHLDALLPREMARRAEEIGAAKVAMDPLGTLALAVLAGAFIALGGVLATTTLAGAGTAPWGAMRVLAGVTFSLGLILVIVGGAELFTGKRNPVTAARTILELGPSFVVVKKGEHGALLIHRDGIGALPAYPSETVIDHTGAGDTFAGGFVGYLAGRPDRVGDRHELRRAMAYGTALASYNVEEFGTERVARLT